MERLGDLNERYSDETDRLRRQARSLRDEIDDRRRRAPASRRGGVWAGLGTAAALLALTGVTGSAVHLFGWADLGPSRDILPAIGATGIVDVMFTLY